MKNIKKISSLLLIMILVFNIAGCSKDEKDSSLKEVSIVLDWTPNTNHTGLYVALEKGYFKELGLKVSIKEPPEGSTTSLIAAGGAEFGISFQDTLADAFAADEPLPVTAVAALIQHNTSGIISVKEKGIDTPSKLEGKNYATWESPIELAMLKKIVTDDGGDFEKVKLIPNTVTDTITAIKTDVDSVWIYYAWDGIASKIANLETNYINFADYGKELDYYSPVIIANNDFLKKDPKTAKKFLEGCKKGYEYAIKNPEKAADILVKEVPELDKELIVESQKWLADQYKAEVDRWGYIEPDRWNAFYNWVSENKLVAKTLKENTGFSNKYLPE
jgi:ABC-type nitrate/sulfonate/bicarbonate transport system substrate-binding protein